MTAPDTANTAFVAVDFAASQLTALLSDVHGQGFTKEESEHYQELVQQVTACEGELNKLDYELTKIAPRTAQTILHRLQLEMGNVYKFAVVLRGDFDNKESSDVDDKKTAMIRQLSEGFKSLYEGAKGAIETVANANLRNVNLQAITISPLQKRIEEEIEATKKQIDSTNTMIDSRNRSINTQMETIRQSNNALQEQQEKLESVKKFNEISRGLLRGFLDGLSLGLAELGHPDRIRIAPLEDHINALTQTISNTRSMIVRIQLDIARDRAALRKLQRTVAALNVLEAQLPTLNIQATRLSTYSTTLAKGLLEVKNAATDIARLIGEVDNKADEVSLAVRKQEYAIRLLKICEVALFDEGVKGEVTLIVDEIVTGYGGALPKEVEDNVSTVRGKLNSSVPAAM
ncbi:hypothetical protein BDZ91DRAFT_794849 [Kalaharituber pfeilii]|nr:hypothetical protein BDZ91DRAFT_794849 [Kalaharituber pfeilii]